MTTMTSSNEERCFRETPYPHPHDCIGCMATSACPICGLKKPADAKCANPHRGLLPDILAPSQNEGVVVQPYQIEAAAKLLHPRKPPTDTEASKEAPKAKGRKGKK